MSVNCWYDSITDLECRIKFCIITTRCVSFFPKLTLSWHPFCCTAFHSFPVLNLMTFFMCVTVSLSPFWCLVYFFRERECVCVWMSSFIRYGLFSYSMRLNWKYALFFPLRHSIVHNPSLDLFISHILIRPSFHTITFRVLATASRKCPLWLNFFSAAASNPVGFLVVCGGVRGRETSTFTKLKIWTTPWRRTRYQPKHEILLLLNLFRERR